jgi:hypothetical protein
VTGHWKTATSNLENRRNGWLLLTLMEQRGTVIVSLMCPRPLPLTTSAQASALFHNGPILSFQFSVAHAEINVKDVRFDLVAGSVLRKLSHLQHVNDAAWISVAPIDELMQNQIEV